ncbi:MAG: hypothetical protein ACOYNI_03290 [Acidimicrobiia bacterium]
MGPERFVEVLRELPHGEIEFLATRLEPQHSTAADEVDAWRVAISVDRALRASRRSRSAARWAHLAAGAVRHSAEAAGIESPDARITMVARSAAEVARALVAGDRCLSELGWLLRDWGPVISRHHAFGAA